MTLVDPAKVSIGRLVRGVTAAIAGWNNDSEGPEYVEVRDGALLVRSVCESQNSLPVGTGNTLVFSGQVTWPNSSAAGTVQILDIPMPEIPSEEGKYLVSIVNGSDTTGLAVTAANRMTAEGNTHDIPVAGWSLRPGEKRGVPVGFWLLGDGGRLLISNDTALGAGGGFTALVLVHMP